MKNIKRLMTLLLALCLCAALCACGGSKAPASTATDLNATPAPTPAADTSEPTAEPTEEPAPEVDAELPVNVMVLNGTTGFGMAKLINDAAEGKAALNYAFSVESDASNITAALANGTADIAALPTNAAAAMYNKTNGGVQLLALNTRGVLYVVVNTETESIKSLADLAGKTVYVPAQNPSFIFSYICQKNGLDDVTIDNTYAQPADLRTALAAGDVSVAVLPEPMVTIALSANDKLAVALDLTKEWDEVSPAGSLVQGCVVVRTEFAAEHPTEVAAFLEEYEKSVALLTEDADTASQLIESTGVFAKGAVAKKALPNCNVCFITGEDMKAAMSDFLDIMFSVAPNSVGGAVPGDDFYYIP